ncbi:hypothetical protein [Flexibacterium corallicola]|uniref:hypothetical protein n=1 Tax=Flexibacterium corallicola TaxID=3037259 RepID=UPI00286EDA48|nr:hypothetical protein [Pseudovibrio sp. M1P-2-3]
MFTKRNIWIAGFGICFVILLSFPFHWGSAQTQVIPVDGVQEVVLNGTNMAMEVRTFAMNEEESQQIKLETSDEFGCKLLANYTRHEDTLTLTFKKRDWSLWGLCTPTANLHLPEHLGLQIDLEALAADIRGTFQALNISSHKTALEFTGQADRFSLEGEAAVINLEFLGPILNDDLILNVEKLISRVRVP